MIFAGGVGWSLIGFGGRGGTAPKKKSFNRLLIHISIVDGYISMFEVDKLSSFFTKLSKNNMGASWGASDAPNTPCDGGITGGI